MWGLRRETGAGYRKRRPLQKMVWEPRSASIGFHELRTPAIYAPGITPIHLCWHSRFFNLILNAAATSRFDALPWVNRLRGPLIGDRHGSIAMGLGL